jgi:hypothetical protein
MEFITILILAIAIFTVAFLVKNVQKAKDEKKGIYANEDKCPYHGEVGYETSAPVVTEVAKTKPEQKKKPATKKPAAKPTAKKPASSQKKK